MLPLPAEPLVEPLGVLPPDCAIANGESESAKAVINSLFIVSSLVVKFVPAVLDAGARAERCSPNPHKQRVRKTLTLLLRIQFWMLQMEICRLFPRSRYRQ